MRARAGAQIRVDLRNVYARDWRTPPPVAKKRTHDREYRGGTYQEATAGDKGEELTAGGEWNTTVGGFVLMQEVGGAASGAGPCSN